MVTVPPKVGALEPKLFAWVFNIISVFALVAVKLEAPVIFKTPLSDNCPPTVTPKVPLIVEAPKTNASTSVTLTLLALLIAKVSKSFPELSVILWLEPALKVAVPALSVITPTDCVRSPLLLIVKLPTG